MSAEAKAREDICRVGLSLFSRGYVHGTTGNISVLLGDGSYLITPTDASLGHLDPARLAKLGPDLKQMSGDKASKTITLHQTIYQHARVFDPDTSCVIHTHSSHCVQLSLRHAAVNHYQDFIPAISPYFVMKVGHVPHLAYARPGSPEAAQAVATNIEAFGKAGTPIRAVMLSKLGPNVWHSSPDAAMAVLEELEESARLCCDFPAGEALPELTPSQIQDLRQSFGARW